MAQLTVTRTKGTITVRLGRAVEHISIDGKTHAQLFDALKYAIVSKGVSIEDAAVAELLYAIKEHPPSAAVATADTKERKMPTDYVKQGVAMSARNKAIQALIKKHQEEFDVLLGDAREDAGLTRDHEAELKLQRIERLKAQLKELGVEV